jgi:hypothetical protein
MARRPKSEEQKAKHTPGPWDVGREVASRGSLVYIQILPRDGNREPVSSVSVYQYDAKGQVVGERDRSGHVAPTVPNDETRANAHLIAAAPELLDACRQFVAAHEADDKAELANALASARAAIAKAEGK